MLGRRHDDLRPPAGVLLDLSTVVELEILADANAHLGQPLGIAGDRDARPGEARIGLDESIRHLGRRGRDLLRRGQIIVRDLHQRARLAHRLEEGMRAQARAGAALLPNFLITRSRLSLEMWSMNKTVE